MNHHPRGVAVPDRASRPAAHRASILIAMALAVMLGGCTPPDVPVLPAEQFEAFADRDADVVVTVDAFATAGSDIVALTTAEGRISVPTLWHSADSGATWQQGDLSDQAAEATQIGEHALGLAAVSVTGEGRRWLALGWKDLDVLAWTSTDGTSWDRATTTGLDPRVTRLHDLQATPDGFALVGAIWDPEEDSHTPQVWTSPDGITWAAHAMFGLGSVNSLAIHDSTWVAVGHEILPAMDADGRKARPLAFVSQDAGASWTRQELPEPGDSAGFHTTLASVARTADGFMAGGSYYTADRDTYRSWTLASPDGLEWHVGASVPAVDQLAGVQDIMAITQGTVLLESLRPQAVQTVDAYAQTADGWDRLDIPDTDGRTWTEAAAVSGEALIWAVGSERTRSVSRIWRTTDLGASWAELRLPVPEGMRPRVEPTNFAMRDGVLTVWGNAQGATSLWTRADDGTWGAPRSVRDEEHEEFKAVRTGPAGWLVLGSKEGEAQVLVSADAHEWTERGPGTFNPVEAYHHSSVSDARWFRDRWVVVGQRSTNGNVRESALVASSTDGQAWEEGTHTRVLQTGDSYDDVDLATDLDGLENMGRAMWGLGETPGGLVAAGELTAEHGSRPAVWLSPDGREWRLRELPFGGYVQGGAAQVLTHGDTLLLVGSGVPEGASERVPLVWRSTDGGASFARERVGEQGRFTGLHTQVDANGFVMVVDQPGSEPPMLWRSANGVAWESTPIDVPHAAEGVEAGVHDAIVDGDTLLVLMDVSNRVDAVPVVVEVPLT